MARQLLQNCGQAIEPFLREFFVTRWQEIDTFYPDDNLSRTEVRIRDNMQAVYIAGVIAEKVFDFGFSPRRVVRAIFLELLAEKKKEGSLVERFLSFLRDYYFINKAFFFKVTGNRVEPGGDDFRPALARDRLQARCLGYVFNDVDLGIVRSQFNQVVREFGAGNTERMILKKLKEQDKILYTGEAHIRVKKQIDGESVSLIYFPGFLDNIDDDSL